MSVSIIHYQAYSYRDHETTGVPVLLQTTRYSHFPPPLRSFHGIHNVVDRGVLRTMWAVVKVRGLGGLGPLLLFEPPAIV